MRWRWLALVFTACLEPTQVKVRLTTDACDSIAETEIFLGDSTTASATTTACSAQIGSIVMIPASARDAIFTVRVRACDKTKAHCIKASRRVGFVEHTPLELPIALDRSCVDVACSPDQTCSKGGCVDDDVSNRCVGNVCEPPLPEGGAPDAAPPCTPPWVNAPSGSSPYVWHFDALPVVDEGKLCPQAPAIEIGPGMGTCGLAGLEKAFDGGSTARNLGCPSNPGAGSSFHVAFWFRVPQLPAMLVSKMGVVNAMASGWAFDMSVPGVLQFVASAPGVPSFQAAIGPQLVPGTWHSVEVHMAGQLLRTWIDKTPQFTMTGVMVGPSTNGDLVIGPLTNGAVDELWIYP